MWHRDSTQESAVSQQHELEPVQSLQPVQTDTPAAPLLNAADSTVAENKEMLQSSAPPPGTNKVPKTVKKVYMQNFLCLKAVPVSTMLLKEAASRYPREEISTHMSKAVFIGRN